MPSPASDVFRGRWFVKRCEPRTCSVDEFGTAPVAAHADVLGVEVRLRSAVVEQLRILAVAGIAVGVVVVGLGSRVAMFALRLTSPDSVIGVKSDDDFTIGEFTLAGTYNLAMLGASVGIVGVAAYQCVSPRLIGPTWFKRLTVALAAGAVVGSMLVNPDGIDFRVLKPTWFAVGSFVLLPAVFGATIGPVVDRVSQPTSRTATGRASWILPVVLVVAFPLSLLTLAISTTVFAAWRTVADGAGLRRLCSGRLGGLVAQACWMGIALLGLVALVGDVRELT